MTAEADLVAAVLERVARLLPGAEAATNANRHRLALTRFANSVIHQNVAEDITTVRLTVHHQGRTASGSSSIVDTGDLDAFVERTVAAVRLAPRDPSWPGLGLPTDPASTRPVGPDAEVPPSARAQVVRDFVDAAQGFETAGYCRTNHWTGAFASSAGHHVTGEATECGASGIARRQGADGVARHAPLDIAALDGRRLGARAAAKVMSAADAIELPAGRHEVVLEPTAVADILEALAVAGFNGRAVNEQRSFVRVGEAQFDTAISLVDDPIAVGQGYDNDGTPRQRLVLVDRGTTVALTHDRRSAAECGARSTGHAVDLPFASGPSARHLGMLPSGHGPGDADDARDEDALDAETDGPPADAGVAELVARMERGVLVTDFWYTRMLDPRTLAITGLTRNGVWLVEDGVITRPVRNFRFTQSYAQALMPGNVLGVGRVATAVPGDTYTATSPRWSCPALHLASWNFTGGASG